MVIHIDLSAPRPSPVMELLLSECQKAMSLPAKFEALRQEFEEALRPIEITPDFWRQMEAGCDILSVFCPGPGRSDEDRVASAERLLDRLPYIVHSSRRRIIRRALGDQAPLNEQLRQRARGRLVEAVQELADHHPNDPENLQILVRNLNRTIPEDFLGPEWQRQYGASRRKGYQGGEEAMRNVPKEVPLSEVEDSGEAIPARGYEIVGRHNGKPLLSKTADPKAELAAKESLLRRAKLTGREWDVVNALLEHGDQVKDAAAALGISPTTISVHLRNIRNKITASS